MLFLGIERWFRDKKYTSLEFSYSITSGSLLDLYYLVHISFIFIRVNRGTFSQSRVVALYKSLKAIQE